MNSGDIHLFWHALFPMQHGRNEVFLMMQGCGDGAGNMEND